MRWGNGGKEESAIGNRVNPWYREEWVDIGIGISKHVPPSAIPWVAGTTAGAITSESTSAGVNAGPNLMPKNKCSHDFREASEPWSAICSCFLLPIRSADWSSNSFGFHLLHGCTITTVTFGRRSRASTLGVSWFPSRPSSPVSEFGSTVASVSAGD